MLVIHHEHRFQPAFGRLQTPLDAELVTLDRAFRQFRGLDVEVIGQREML